MIIEVKRHDLSDYMQMNFFGPLQMTHTHVFDAGRTLTATPLPFEWNGRYWKYIDFLSIR